MSANGQACTAHAGSSMALIAASGECTRPVEIAKVTMRDFALEAAHRQISTEALVGQILDVIATDDLFSAVLDR